jgi:hypothetical protein
MAIQSDTIETTEDMEETIKFLLAVMKEEELDKDGANES